MRLWPERWGAAAAQDLEQPVVPDGECAVTADEVQVKLVEIEQGSSCGIAVPASINCIHMAKPMLP